MLGGERGSEAKGVRGGGTKLVKGDKGEKNESRLRHAARRGNGEYT